MIIDGQTSVWVPKKTNPDFKKKKDILSSRYPEKYP